MKDPEGNLYEFGAFRLDTGQRVLSLGGATVSLAPKVVDVLCILVERGGRVVSKNELMESVWRDSFVEDSNLTQSIYSLRRVLGKDEDDREFIENIPRRGYRFIAPVKKISPGPDPGDAIKSDTPTQKTPAKRRLRSLLAYGGALALLGCIAFLAIYLYSNRTTPAPVEKVRFQKLTFSGDIGFAVISPDGQSIAYVKDGAINLQDIGSGSSFKLSIPEHTRFANLQFSNDGESIYFRNEDSIDAEGEVFQVSRFGGTARSLAKKVWGGVGFSPDARRFAFARFYPAAGEWDLIVRNIETGEEDKLFACNLPFSIFRSGGPAWSPDAHAIAIVKQSPDQAASSNLILIDVATRRSEQLATPRFTQIEQVAWMPDGRRLLVTGRENNRFFQLWEMDLAGGEPRPITNDLNIYRGLSVSADGKSVVARQFSIFSHIWVAPSDDLQSQRQITFGNLNRDGNAGIGWSPDGKIVYSSRITGNTDIWMVGPDDGVRKQLTENAGNNNESPFVSPDGQYVYYQSTRSGRRHIWRSDINGANPVQITFADNETDFWPVTSPDGNTLYYIQRSPRSSVIWRQSLADGTREMLTTQGELSPANFLSISGDGRLLAFENIREDKKADASEIGILDIINGNKPRTVTLNTPNTQIEWAADGRYFDYVENLSAGAKFWRQSMDGSGEKKLLFELPNARIFGFAWSADRKTLALARGRQENDAILLRGFE